MRGAVAAGNRHTAEAGAWALARGGNSVDAVVAAAVAAFVAEGPLTGPSGGGFLLLRDSGREPTVLDCFFAVPSRRAGEMDEVLIDFGDASTQVFHVGSPSVAVPGLVPGLWEAHEKHGRVPWADLFTPAIALAETGVEMTGPQRFLLEILVPILERTEEGRAIYGSRARAETRVMVDGLERLRDVGPAAVAEFQPDLASDIEEYRVIERRPTEASFRGMRVATCPPPSLGGGVVAGGLRALDGLGAGEDVALAVALVDALRCGYGGSAGPGLTGTTHVSVIDEEGNAAALSSTLGSGSGRFSRGFQLNNMLGELDVIGQGERAAGERLPSMMAPTLVLADGEPRLVVGSAGSVRLSGAIMQVIHHVVAGGESVASAIDHARLHVEDDVVQIEGGWPHEVMEALEETGQTVNCWASRNLYFGGVSAVERLADGRLGAAGDPRRGGHGIVVP
ncbi:gamma-glutamyltransferase [Gaiella sp.]|uniref:gamma-glutamyltransferase n=1 Tax=Gaiella sp. TaxID=2663207 RepID=UPI003263A316